MVEARIHSTIHLHGTVLVLKLHLQYEFAHATVSSGLLSANILTFVSAKVATHSYNVPATRATSHKPVGTQQLSAGQRTDR
jgi:hypothetical protein